MPTPKRKAKASVPPHWIKDAEVDWSGEMFAAAGLPLVLSDAVSVPPVSFGVWSMLELLDCDFCHPQKEPTEWGAIVALYLAVSGESALPLVRDALAAGIAGEGVTSPDLCNITAPDPLTVAALKTAEAAEMTEAKTIALSKHLHLAFSGFAMIPSIAPESGKYLFALDSFASMVAGVGQELQASPSDILWHTPLCLIGHLMAAKQKINGVKGIRRPKDKADIALQLQLCRDRIEAGVLHPWQEAEPEIYGKLGHETDAEFYRLCELAEAKKGRAIAARAKKGAA